MNDPADPEPWSPTKRDLFRLAFVYLVLYSLPFPLSELPYLGSVAGFYVQLWNALVPWVGKHVFQVAINVFPNGSGDTTFNYVQVACFAALALVASLVWILLDRKRPHHARLQLWLRTYVRFVLASTLLSYGAFKIIPSQFPAPNPGRLAEPFGEASPMGILWTFMGASGPYTRFAGALEVLAGALLVARRTTTLGALLACAVMGNVVMMNFCYDVPVKLYSLHLLAMAVFLVLPDLGWLARVFLLRRPGSPAGIQPLFTRRWLHRGALALRTLFFLWGFGQMLWLSYTTDKSFREMVRPEIGGVWTVTTFEQTAEGTPIEDDSVRWERVIIASATSLSIQRKEGPSERLLLALDEPGKKLELSRRDDPAWKATLSYELIAVDTLVLEGEFDGLPIGVELQRAPDPRYLLVERGFHWINETPFNR